MHLDKKLTIMESFKRFSSLLFWREKLQVLFFEWSWFDNIHGIRHNHFSMVEIKHNEQLLGNEKFVLVHQAEHVYYLSYPCQQLNVWAIVYKVNPCEHLHTPSDAAYHIEDEHVDEIYQKKHC